MLFWTVWTERNKPLLQKLPYLSWRQPNDLIALDIIIIYTVECFAVLALLFLSLYGTQHTNTARFIHDCELSACYP